MAHIRVTLSTPALDELRRRSAGTGRNIAIEATLALEAALRGVEAMPNDTTSAIEKRSRERDQART